MKVSEMTVEQYEAKLMEAYKNRDKKTIEFLDKNLRFAKWDIRPKVMALSEKSKTILSMYGEGKSGFTDMSKV